MISVIDQFMMSPFGQWAARYRAALLSAAVALLLAAGWAAADAARSPTVQAKEALAAWKKLPEDEALFKTLLLAARSDPAVRAAAAQILLTLGRADDAEALVRESLECLRKIAPAHASFAEISLLICRQHYQEALERSVSLKKWIGAKDSVLYGKNLMRIAFLQQQLGNQAGEIVAWRELEEKVSLDYDPVLDGLGNRKSGLQAYLAERKRAL